MDCSKLLICENYRGNRREQIPEFHAKLNRIRLRCACIKTQSPAGSWWTQIHSVTISAPSHVLLQFGLGTIIGHGSLQWVQKYSKFVNFIIFQCDLRGLFNSCALGKIAPRSMQSNPQT
jgi:hypothetical protein